MKKITRYSIAFCDTPELSSQFGTWGNCWDTEEEVRNYIQSEAASGWSHRVIIATKGQNAFQTCAGWLVIEPVEFIHLDFIDKIFHKNLRAQADSNGDIRITKMAAQGSVFHLPTKK